METQQKEKKANAKSRMYIYAFQNNQFKEEVKYVSIFGTDGENTRMIQGTLTETYDSNNAVKFVVIVNGENKRLSQQISPVIIQLPKHYIIN